MDDVEDIDDPNDSEIINAIIDNFQQHKCIKQGIFITLQWTLNLYPPFKPGQVV